MEKLSLVAYYGDKPDTLARYIRRLQSRVEQSSIGKWFEPYQMDQVHATLIGLEAKPVAGKLRHIHANEDGVDIRFPGLLKSLESMLPLSIQFGGFAAEYEGFLSNGKRPYERSFGLNWQAGRVVAMGWPMEGSNLLSSGILDIRNQSWTRHGIRHKYADDNDCYMVLGILAQSEASQPVQEQGKQLEAAIRSELSRQLFQVSLELSDLSIVGYQSPQLPPASTEVFPLVDFAGDEERIRTLYEGD